jgi:flagellar motility protein MotE (MotC chaperone)
MSKLANPFLAAAVAVLLGTGTGLFTFWRVAAPALVAAARLAPHPDAVVTEAREQGWDFWTIEIENLANELKDERARLRLQAEQQSHREAQLAAERQELNKVRTEIEGLKSEIATKVIEINTDELKNVRSLAQTYTNLTPAAAVAIIKEMEDSMVVKILSLMKPDVVAPIFEQMSRTATPDGTLAHRAAVLSDRLRLMKSTKTATNP